VYAHIGTGWFKNWHSHRQSDIGTGTDALGDFKFVVLALVFTVQNVHWSLLYKIYTGVYCTKCTLVFTVQQNEHWCLLYKMYTGVYCTKYTLVFTVQNVHWCLLYKIYTGVYCTKCALVFTVQQNVHWCLLYKMYTGVYCTKCTLVFTVQNIHWCLLYKIYTGVYCTKCTLVLTPTLKFAHCVHLNIPNYCIMLVSTITARTVFSLMDIH
jgi:hypothetical protein